jgi:NADP-reducing hydrogenase subunit HndC
MLDFGARKRVAVCHGPHCSRRGSASLYALLEEELAARGLDGEVASRPGACNKLCEEGPSMVVHPDRVWYSRLTPDVVREIVRRHLSGGEPVRAWVARDLGPQGDTPGAELEGAP